jgi:UDPglucose 6-dehydrogenase
MQIAVVGTGYVGLCTAVALASRGHSVRALDIRQDVVDALNRGVPHIHERDLPELLKSTIANGSFSAHLAEERQLDGCDVVLIAVGTPSTNGRIDLTYVKEAARFIGSYLKNSRQFLSVVVKSTVVPGTTDTVVRQILEDESGHPLGEFGLGMNPEFLREGVAISDCLNPDRIVFGHEDPGTLARLEDLYASWKCDKIAVNTRTAELIKYANNALLATQISAVNELANLAAALGGVDILDVMRGVHADKRWSPITASGERIRPEILTYLMPGCGFGGSCFPKDVQALRTLGTDLAVSTPLLHAVLDLNEHQPTQVALGLARHFGSLAGKKLLLLGLAFKPGTDDVRESTSIIIARDLVEHGATVLAHDPVAIQTARAGLAGLPITYLDDWKAALPDVDGVVLATRWEEYEAVMSEPLSTHLRGKVVFDARRVLRAGRLPGATYLGIGWAGPSRNPHSH